MTAVLVALVSVIGGIITLFVKSHLENKARIKGSNAILETVKGMEKEVVNLARQIISFDKKLTEHVQDSEFVLEFKNALQMKSTTMLTLGRVDLLHKNILSYFEDLVEKFGLRYCYSPYRKGEYKDKVKLREMLESDYEIKRAYFCKYTDEMIDEVRYREKKAFYFTDLLNKSKAGPKTELLIETLIRNGYETPQELVKDFEQYMVDIYNIYLDTVSLWNTLEVKDYKQDEVA